jgi:hypothetical protein
MMKLAENETNIRNMEPDILLMRALIVDFVERYDEMSEALLAWHQNPDSKTKPRKIIDISDAGRLIDMCSRIIERQHKIEQTGSISLETLRRVMEMMGLAVTQVVKNNDLLTQIETRWAGISIDTRPSAESDKDEVIDAETVDDSDEVDENDDDDE